jgi:hypothetical protein
LDPDAVVLSLKKAWPTIIGDTQAYFFEMTLGSNAPDLAGVEFRKLVYGAAV